VIAAKTRGFWSNTKCFPSESVDLYYNHFHEILDDLADAEEPVSTRRAICHFIFTLGPEFESIQNNFCITNLPEPWKTQDWPSLLVLCRDYYNSVKPTLPNTGCRHPQVDTPFDRAAHQEKFREWFLNPVKFCKVIESEQHLHPSKCIYHLAKTHPTEDCAVKKECDRIFASKNTSMVSNSSSSATGQLRHIMENIFEDAENDDNQVDVDSANNTNQDILNYFQRFSNHFLCLAKATSSTSSCPRHHMKYPVIADSGANFHMFKEFEFFTQLTPTQGQVILGDGKNTLLIHGIGTVTCQIGDHILNIEDVRYVPDLGESIYSLFRHIQTPNHSLHSSYEDGLTIIFPQFCTKATLGINDIYLDALPLQHHQNIDLASSYLCLLHRLIIFAEILKTLPMKSQKKQNI